MRLLENGLDSFKDALEKLFDIDDVLMEEKEYKLKEIIFSFHHSLEVLFKYLIQEKSKYFIYENQKEVFEYESGLTDKSNNMKEKAYKTIQFLDAIHRANVLYELNFNKNVYKKIKFLNEKRNSLTHHECDLEIREIEDMIATILPSILEIFNKHISGFNEYMEKYKLSSNIENLYTKTDIWKMGVLLNTLNKIENAEKQFKDLKANGEIEKKMKDRKSLNYNFGKCEVCQKEYFVSKGIIIEACNTIAKYGECLLCGFKLEKDTIILRHNSFSPDPELDLKEFIEESIETLIIDFKYNYGITIVEGIEDILHKNMNIFKRKFDNIINRIIRDSLQYIMDNQIEKDIWYEENKDINYIIKAFDKLKPEGRVYILERIWYCRGLIIFYENNTSTNFVTTNNDHTICNEYIMCSPDNFLNLYKIWLEGRNSNDKAFIWFEGHKDYNKIIDEIIGDIYNGEIWSDLCGSSKCDFGYIDRVEVDGCDLEYIETFIKDEHFSEIVSVFGIEISTELYSDHEYIRNGSTCIYIEANINLNEDCMEVKKLRLL